MEDVEPAVAVLDNACSNDSYNSTVRSGSVLAWRKGWK